MAEMVKYLIVGGGLAGATAAQTIRKTDSEGSILILCGENHLPYNRPPLSKEYLRGESSWQETLVAPESAYHEANIAWRLGVQATAVDTDAKTVMASDGSTVGYEKLCIATGASPKKLDPAEIPGAYASNIFYLRTLDQSDTLRAQLVAGKSVVILGAGYIGTETAAGAASKGLEVTVIDTADRPWSRNTSPEFGAFFQKYYEARGVRFLLGDSVTEFEIGESGEASAVKTKSGQRIPLDFAIAGVGAKLNLDLVKDIAGLEVDEKEGVTVNEYLESAIPGVYIAGDIAKFHDPVLKKDWHVEHWQNAEWHGQVAGANMAGERTAYDHVPYFFSDEFDLHVTQRGDPMAGKAHFIIGNTESDTSRFVELYLREDGTLAMGIIVSKEMDEDGTSDLLEKLIRAHTPIAEHQEALQSGAATLESMAK